MPYFLEKPDSYAHVMLTRVDLPAPSFADLDGYLERYFREYCWVLEGTVFKGEKNGEVIEVIQPQQRLVLQYSPLDRQDYFEVEGPVRMISIKEFVQLYDEYRAQRELPPFQWDESVTECIRTFEEYEAKKEKK